MRHGWSVEVLLERRDVGGLRGEGDERHGLSWEARLEWRLVGGD